jgi:threonine/homoserine/homoserine lactone efflux protein
MSTNLGIHDFWIFLTTGILLNLTPGQDTFYILGRTLAQGRRAGVASVLGISTGSLFHTLAAATGLSALLAASASAFIVIKFIGGGYLVCLGARMLFSSATPVAMATAFSEGNWPAIIFRQGMLTNLLNPKVALFYLAFVPQFIAPDSNAKFLAFAALGLCFLTTGTLWCLCLVWFAASLRGWLEKTSGGPNYLKKIAGAVFVLLGVRLLMAKV